MDGTFAVEGLKETEAVNQDGASTLASALGQVNLSTVVDPATPAETSGLDKPDLFRAKTRDGLVYTVSIGKALPERYGRYARIDVAYEKPPPPLAPALPPAVDTNAPPIDILKGWEEKSAADAQKAAAEKTRLAPWTFVLLDSDCRNMTASRDQVVTVTTNDSEVSTTVTNSP